jgi:hypothetical protein
MPTDPLRKHLQQLLEGGNAHAKFDEAVADLEPAMQGTKPPNCPYTAWQLLEHLRITQWDILEFSRDSNHKSPKWPADYWPKTEAPPTPDAWEKSVESFRKDAHQFLRLISDPEKDLYQPIPHGEGQTLLREALLVADHNSYHIGQLILVRKLLGAWNA